MSWLRRVFGYLRPGAQVVKPPELPPASVKLQREAKEVLHDLREVRRLEVIVRKR